MAKKKRCPTPWKLKHMTQEEAEAHQNWLRKDPTGRLQTAYQCGCGAFHVGDPRWRRRRGR